MRSEGFEPSSSPQYDHGELYIKLTSLYFSERGFEPLPRGLQPPMLPFTPP